MTNTFGGRVHAAMLAAGIETAAQLAGRLKDTPRQTAQRWLSMKEAELSGAHLFELATVLGVRMRWLASGVGVLHRRQDLDVERAAALLGKFTKVQRDKWFAYGGKLLAK